jgi:hypothetical protein
MMMSPASADFLSPSPDERCAHAAVFALVGRSDDELTVRQAELERLLTARPSLAGAVALRTELAYITGLLADRRTRT